jgi:hypothetical protein
LKNALHNSFDFSGAGRTSRYIQIHDEEEAYNYNYILTISDNDENPISAQNLESHSYYEFRKILSSESYSPGQKVAKFLRDFHESYPTPELGAENLPRPVLEFKVSHFSIA